tara:strand:+ start:20665 stop:20940 length:276 start_codon:yes stop_codon:yes gene_type:complete
MKATEAYRYFQAHYTQGTLEEYLSFFGESPNHPYLDLIPAPIRNINTELVRQIIQACRQQKRLDNYHHKPEGQQIIIDSDCWKSLKPYRMD